MRKRKFDISYFICPECGNSFPLPRSKNVKRNRGHVKDLYCFYCNKVVKTTEIRSGDYYVRNNGVTSYV